jgi:hypothetical protein
LLAYLTIRDSFIATRLPYFSPCVADATWWWFVGLPLRPVCLGGLAIVHSLFH